MAQSCQDPDVFLSVSPCQFFCLLVLCVWDMKVMMGMGDSWSLGATSEVSNPSSFRGNTGRKDCEGTGGQTSKCSFCAAKKCLKNS